MTDTPQPVAVPAGNAAPGAVTRKQRPLSGGLRRRGPMVLLMVVSIVVLFLSLANIASNDAALTGATFAPSIVAICRPAIWHSAHLTYLQPATSSVCSSFTSAC
jgi:hypothetical protein